jgi:putative phage-type endonuclease
MTSNDNIFDIFGIAEKDRHIESDRKTKGIDSILAKAGIRSLKKEKENTSDKKIDENNVNNSSNNILTTQDMRFARLCKYKRPSGDKFGPYSGTWVHDQEQIDDSLDEENKKRTKILNKLLEKEFPPQRSPKWFELREGSITASDCGCVLGDNSHEPPYKIIVKKLLKPPFEPNMFCYHGTKYEQIATMVYEYRMNVRVEEFGLVKHPKYDFLAASPDGIVGEFKLDGKSKTKFVGRMLEIKCPAVRKLKEDDPFYSIKYYYDQVQLQLECCSLEECDFWQNTIYEYSSRDEFIEDTDTDEPFRSKKTGMEKGCLIQLLPKDKLVEKRDNHNDVVCAFSKFLYPPKIDMLPLECDTWIAESLSNIEKTLIKEVMKKYTLSGFHKKVQESIKKDDFGNFLQYMKGNLDNAIEKAIKGKEWLFNGKPDAYVNTIKKRTREETTEKFKNEYLNSYPEKLMLVSKNEDLVKYLVKANVKSKYNDMVNDPELIKKMTNLNDYPDFYKIIDDDSLKFVKDLCQLLKDLEFANNYTFDRVFYWRFEKTLCTTVKRDREWFKEKLPVLEQMWNYIVFLRRNPEKAKELFEYIDSLPTVAEHYGHKLKDNDMVMEKVASYYNSK